MLDYCVIGGGILGLATAMRLLELRPGAGLLLIEKEAGLARHQTGHNSGVIHAGIYYKPGSLKAELCRRGSVATKQFCTEHSVRFETCGKLVVATNEPEMARMKALYARSQTNAIEVEELDAKELSRREPAITGLGALFVKQSGIVDYKGMCEAMGNVIRAAGGTIEFNVDVSGIEEKGDAVTVLAGDRRIEARQLVVCGGLQADRLVTMAGLKADFRIVPFRGEYFRLPAGRNSLIKHLIYPVPDPELPFLGIHLTRMIDGGITVGPNAVIGFAREGYAKTAFNLPDIADYAAFGGFWKLVWKNRKSARTELVNSLWKSGYLEDCRKYCPSLSLADLLPETAGIRAQAVSKSGVMIDDFQFVETDRMLHVCNAPSPAATSSIPIGEMIADKLLRRSNAGPLSLAG